MPGLRMVKRDMQTRSHYVADRIDSLMNGIAEEASNDGWDGRELLTGLGVALGRACERMQITPRQAIDMVQRLDLGTAEKKEQWSGLVDVAGRPLAAPPRKV